MVSVPERDIDRVTEPRKYKARTRHYCTGCGATIDPGVEYWTYRTYGARVGTIKRCAACTEVDRVPSRK